MSTPKHRTAPDSSYFVTTKCWQRRSILRLPDIAKILIETLCHYRQQATSLLHEYAILLTPSPTTSPEKTVQFIESGYARPIHLHRGHKLLFVRNLSKKRKIGHTHQSLAC
jgi:hypothetical protein